MHTDTFRMTWVVPCACENLFSCLVEYFADCRVIGAMSSQNPQSVMIII